MKEAERADFVPRTLTRWMSNGVIVESSSRNTQFRSMSRLIADNPRDSKPSLRALFPDEAETARRSRYQTVPLNPVSSRLQDHSVGRVKKSPVRAHDHQPPPLPVNAIIHSPAAASRVPTSAAGQVRVRKSSGSKARIVSNCLGHLERALHRPAVASPSRPTAAGEPVTATFHYVPLGAADPLYVRRYNLDPAAADEIPAVLLRIVR